jgi:hypothetical protein
MNIFGVFCKYGMDDIFLFWSKRLLGIVVTVFRVFWRVNFVCENPMNFPALILHYFPLITKSTQKQYNTIATQIQFNHNLRNRELDTFNISIIKFLIHCIHQICNHVKKIIPFIFQFINSAFRPRCIFYFLNKLRFGIGGVQKYCPKFTSNWLSFQKTVDLLNDKKWNVINERIPSRCMDKKLWFDWSQTTVLF